jgi:hypothetical protein
MSPTSQEYFARLDRLFQEAVDLPAGDERDEFLKGASGSDPELVQMFTACWSGTSLCAKGPVAALDCFPDLGRIMREKRLAAVGWARFTAPPAKTAR